MYLKLIMVGNLGADPELRYMPDGTAVCNFSMAVNRRWKSANGEQAEETTWVRVSAWGKMAENANQFLKRGQAVLVEGRLKPDPETGGPRVFNRQDGSAGASFEVTAENIRFLSNQAGSPGQGPGTGRQDPVEEDEIPF